MTMPHEIQALLGEHGYDEVWVDGFPEDPDNCVALFQYAGSPPLNRNIADVEFPGLQICARAGAEAPLEALERLTDITRLLDQTRPNIGGVFYPYIKALQSPFFMRRDENGRSVYAVNFEIHRRY